MRLSFMSPRGTLLALASLLFCMGMRSDAPPQLRSRMASLPRTALWVWDRREDLRRADPGRFAIAFLDQTLTVGLSIDRQPRHNAIAYPAAAKRIAVVRIETTRFAVLDEEARRQIVAAILESAAIPGISALQVDFDATQSQRRFYRNILFDLRRQMPADLPLSITALASWCSWDDWIGDLPVDEAVPMFFRMEPDRTRAPSSLDDFKIREPLCRSSVGVSTTEPWPSAMAHKRIYVFPDRGWRNESLADLQRRLP
jgi:hypothetical protein